MTAGRVPSPAGDVVVAAFDFDETITHHDTVVPFMMRIAGRARFAVGLVRRAPALVMALARRDRNALRSVGTAAAFTGRRLDEIESHAAAWGAEIVHRHLRNDVVARIRWHLDAGHRVVIVSASYEQYVRVVAEHLGVHGVVATRLEVDDDLCTGRLLGPNCRAAEKVVRLDAWFAEHGLSRAELTLWAYGDSAGDRELLAAAQHPHWVAGPLDSVPATP